MKKPSETMNRETRDIDRAFRLRLAHRITSMLVIYATILLAAQAIGAGPSDGQKYSEVVDVQVVRRPFRVTNEKNTATLGGLSAQDFRVYVDGRRVLPATQGGFSLREERATTEQPLDVIVLIDFLNLDMKARAAVADEVDRLAERAPSGVSRFKFYAMLGGSTRLNRYFTRDRDVLHRVAEQIRTAVVGLGEAPRASQVIRSQVATEIVGARMASLFVADGGLGCIHFATFTGVEDSEALAQGDDYELKFSYLSYVYDWLESRGTMAVKQDETKRRRAARSLAQLDASLAVAQAVTDQPTTMLFTSGSLDIARDERFDRDVSGIMARVEQGTQLFIVDVDALWRGGSASQVLGSLAKSSGGEYLRAADGSFDAVLDRCSSRYWIEWRPDRELQSKSVTLDVGIDTTRRPDLWSAKVVGADRLRLSTETARRTERRTAALLSPEDFGTLPLRVDVAYPDTQGPKAEYPIRVRFSLSALEWSPSEADSVEARFAIDLVAGEGTGMSGPTRCDLGADGQRGFSIRVASKDALRAGQSFEMLAHCEGPRIGGMSARAVLVDENASKIAAGQSSMIVLEPKAGAKRVQTPRVFASSEQDFGFKSGMTRPELGEGKTRGREVGANGSIFSDEAMRLEYLLCDSAVRSGPQRIGYRVMRTGEDQRLPVMALSEAVRRPGVEPKKGHSGCARQEVSLPDFSLEPGRYEWEIGPIYRADQPRANDEVYASIPFEIVAR